MVEFAEKQILARVGVDALNRLFVYIPYNLTPAADRASNSTMVMALATTDYQKSVDLQWIAPRVSQLFLSGVVVSSGGTGSPLFSLSPGHTPSLIGDREVLDNLILSSQSQSNSLAGLVYSDRNNPYPDISLDLVADNRAFDIAPNLYATIALDEYSGGILPKVIEKTHEATEDGAAKLKVEISFEAVTTEGLSVNGDIPIGNGEFITPGFGAFPSLPKFDIDVPDLPALDFPGLGDPGVDTPCASYINNMYPLSWSRTTLNGTDSTTLEAHAYFPCKIRAAGSFAPTYIKINGIWTSGAKDNYHVYGTLNGDRILTANVTHNANGNTATFSPVSDTQVDGIDIVLEASIGLEVASGSIDITKNYGTGIYTLVPGNLYAIQATPGPFYPYGTMTASTAYQLGIIGGAFPPEGTNLLGYNFLNGGGYHDDVPYGALYTEWVSSQYLRVYFYADINHVAMRAAVYYPWGLNTGSLGYIIYNAGGYNRTIYLYQATIYNVCAI